MHIQVGPVYSKLHTKDVGAANVLKQVCRARPPGYQFTKKYKKRRWNGYITLTVKSTTFPTGLLGNVVAALRDKGYRVRVEGLDNYLDRSITYNVDPNILHDLTLRHYQVDAVNSLLNAGRGIAKMATNAGKTEVMAAMLALTGWKTIVLVARKELMYQTAERLAHRLQRDVGIIGDGKELLRDITVGMIQTLAKKDVKELQERFGVYDAVFIDECHHGSSAQHMEVLKSLGGFHRYGFSGTPLKYEELADLQLIGFTGNVVTSIDNDELIELGFSAKPIIEMIVIYSPSDEEYDYNYHKAYKELIVRNEERNMIISSVANQHSDDTVLILVNHINHGKILNKLIPRAKFIHGSHSTEYRQEVLSFMREESGVYIASTIVDEGIDIPAINVLILAGGGKTERGLLQRIGRGLRQKDDNKLQIYDFIDDTNKYLIKHSEQRLDVYIKEGFDIISDDEPL